MADGKLFRRALGQFASGVTVLTVRGPDGEDLGMTVSSFCSVSLDPPLVLVCVSRGAAAHGALVAASGFGVSVLADTQQALSDRFAGRVALPDGGWGAWPQERDRFADLPLRRASPTGPALLQGALAALDCLTHAVHEAGDHSIVVGRVAHIEMAAGPATGPLVYHGGRYARLAEDA